MFHADSVKTIKTIIFIFQTNYFLIAGERTLVVIMHLAHEFMRVAANSSMCSCTMRDRRVGRTCCRLRAFISFFSLSLLVYCFVCLFVNRRSLLPARVVILGWFWHKKKCIYVFAGLSTAVAIDQEYQTSEAVGGECPENHH